MCLQSGQARRKTGTSLVEQIPIEGMVTSSSSTRSVKPYGSDNSADNAASLTIREGYQFFIVIEYNQRVSVINIKDDGI